MTTAIITVFNDARDNRNNDNRNSDNRNNDNHQF